LEPIETNDASLLRLSLHQLVGFKFKSLIGRFRISYTEDNRIREQLMPAQTKFWSSIGPFPAVDAPKPYATVFEPEKDIKKGPLDLTKSYDKVVPPPPAPEKKGPDAAASPMPKTAGAAKEDTKPPAKEKEKPTAAKPDVKEAAPK